MTRLAFGALGANSLWIDGLSAGIGTPTIVASPFTGGGPYALECVAIAGTSVYATYAGFTFVNARGYYARARVRISATPGADTTLFGFGTPTSTGAIALGLVSGSRDIRLFAGGSVRGSAGPTLAVDTDYLLEVYGFWNAAGTLDDTVTGRVDGVEFATSTGAYTTTSAGLAPFFGVRQNSGITAHYTDWAINDDQGADDNSWPGVARVAMLLPASDDTGSSSIGADAWRIANSGTSNLYTAVGNAPPIGVASPGTTSPASQIVCDTPSTNRAYTCVTAPYDSLLVAGDTITHVQGLVVHAESINTGTKSGSLGLVANPAGSSNSFTYGDDVGAAGTFPTNWAIFRSNMSLAPTPTRSTGASLRVFAVTSTRNSDVCFMGVYVEYTPAAAPPTTISSRRALLGVGA